MFRFRFETVLTTRRHAEECLQKELSEARRALAAEQAALREKKNARRRCLQDLRRQQRKGFRVPDMLLYGAYLQRLDRDLEAQQQRVTGAERQANQKRQALVEALKKRKILEKLKESDQKNYLKALTERERKFIDDVAARSYSASRSV
jgi:flagellar FliJ protein